MGSQGYCILPFFSNEKQGIHTRIGTVLLFCLLVGQGFLLSHISAYFSAKTQEINLVFLKEISTLPAASL